ncbi:MAG: hypothetical protein HOV79_10030 [Hamadaea sp.]|nr:hypothetical protein [Hamadaea sp.]
MITGAVAALVPLVALAVWAAPHGTASPTAPVPDPECAVLSVRSGSVDGPSMVAGLDPATGAIRSARLLDRRITALGRDTAAYGIGQRRGERAQFVRLGPRGEITVLGPARGLGDVFVGAVHAGVWYLLSHDRLVTVRVDGAARSAPLRLSEPVSVGDWDYDPQRGALLTLASNRLISVDPRTAVVSVLATPRGLPPGDYGAVWLDHRSRALFALHNRSGATYRVPLAGPPVATVSSVGSPVVAADAAGCPPITPAPSPSPSASLSLVRPPPSPASPQPSASAVVVASPASPQPSAAVSSQPPRLVVAAPRPPSPRARPAPVAPPRMVPPLVAPLGVPPKKQPAWPRPPAAAGRADQIAVSAQRRSEERERSRRRVAAAAAILTLGGMLARSRARSR